MAELLGCRLSTVLAADTTLEVGTYGATLFYGHLDELTYTVLVENLEGSTFRIFFSR